MQALRSLAVLAASVGGLYLLANGQPRPVSQPAPVVATPVVVPLPQPKAAPKEVAIPKLRAPAPIVASEKASKRKKKRETKAERAKPKRTAFLPSCARIKAQYDRMSLSERWSAYQTATPEQIAHGRRCLGL